MKTHPTIQSALNSLADYTKLLQAGVPADQALRIAFGDEVAQQSIKQVEDISNPKQRPA